MKRVRYIEAMKWMFTATVTIGSLLLLPGGTVSAQEENLQNNVQENTFVSYFYEPWIDNLSEENLADMTLSGKWVDIEDYATIMVPETMIDITKLASMDEDYDERIKLELVGGGYMAVVIVFPIEEQWPEMEELEMYGPISDDNPYTLEKVVMAGGIPSILSESNGDEDEEIDELILAIPDAEKMIGVGLTIYPSNDPAYYEETKMLLNSFKLK